MGGLARLGAARTRVNRFLRDTCVLYRGTALVTPQPTMPDGSPLRCAVVEDTVEQRTESAPRQFAQRRWILSLPDGLDIRVGDQLQVLGCLYGVVQVAAPSSYSVQTTCFAYLLVDAGGGAHHILANATVSITHGDATPGPQHIRVYIRAPEQTQVFTALGGEVTTAVYFDSTQDIRVADDRMVVEELDGFPSVSAKPVLLFNVARVGGTATEVYIRAEARGFIT